LKKITAQLVMDWRERNKSTN